MFLHNQRGAVMMIVALFFTLMGIMVLLSQIVPDSVRRTKLNLNATAQADNVARGGLVDALVWFQNKVPQPVTSFAPDSEASSDPATGLVQDYQIGTNPGLWAHYEVRKDSGVQDITLLRSPSPSPAGAVWYLEAAGYVYQMKDSSKKYNQYPNTVIARSRTATEIQRLTFTRPDDAAVIVGTGSWVTLNGGGFTAIDGTCPLDPPSVGVAYCYGPAPAGAITGCPQPTRLLPSPFSMTSVFGFPESTLMRLADVSVDLTRGDVLPVPYPSMGVVYVKGNALFDSDPLIGGGVLFVRGNLTLAAIAGKTHLFSGLIYVTGDATIFGGASIAGTLICENHVTLNGGAVDTAAVKYDATLMNGLSQRVGNYKEIKSSNVLFTGVP